MNFSDLLLLTRSDQSGSVIVRGFVWLIGVLLAATAIDNNKNERGMRIDLGWFFLFLFTVALLSYFIFGFVPTF